MTDKLNFGTLHRLLKEHGFVRATVKGPYVIFKHEGIGALQAFRPHRASEAVDPMTQASVRKTLVEFGLMDEGEFDEAVRQVPAKRKAKAPDRTRGAGRGERTPLAMREK